MIPKVDVSNNNNLRKEYVFRICSFTSSVSRAWQEKNEVLKSMSLYLKRNKKSPQNKGDSMEKIVILRGFGPFWYIGRTPR